MEIILGKNAGFCYGVQRAVNGAREESKKEKKIYCLGEIVHNKNVVETLKKEGIEFIENIDEAKGKTIIRAHGIAKEVYNKAKEKNIEIKDLTCPSVLKIHKIAEQYSAKDYFIIITGKKEHPEVIGIVSYCNKYVVVKEQEEIEQILDKIKNEKNILLISQTTYSSKKFDKIEQYLKQHLDPKVNFEVKKTICPSTETRQKETEEIAKQVDLMLIIGDKKSSNTTKLYEISSEFCKNTIFAQSADDINVGVFDKVNKVGIMAGASTPKEDIIKVQEKILKYNK